MSYCLFQKKSISIGLVSVGALVMSAVLITSCTDQAKADKPKIVYKDEPPKPGIIGKINGEEISVETLQGENKLEFLEIEKRKWDLENELFMKLLVDKVIGAKAKKANMSTEEYINKNIVKGDIKISDKDFKKFVAEKHIPESQINPQIKERIIAYLQGTKRNDMIMAEVAKDTKSNPPEFYGKKPKMQVNVDVGQAPLYGKKDAPITVVEFSDFQCPFCNRAADTVTQLKKKYGSKIQIAFKHFPLPMHRDARPASEASMCVNDQGSDKFWKYHDILFKNQDKLDKANLEKFAKDSGADVKKFNECLDSKKYADFVQKDMEYGEKIGVKSTPTFFVNGQLVSGAVPIETFSEIIDEELNTKKK